MTLPKAIERALSRGPSAAAWSDLVAAIDAHAADTDAFLGEIGARLDPWPDALRVAPRHWARTILEGGRPPAWDLVRKLDLRNTQLNAKALEPLFGDACARLTHLDLSDNKLGDVTVARLVQLPALSRLRSLSLQSVGLGGKGLVALAESSALGALGALSIGNSASRAGKDNTLPAAAFKAFATSPRMAQLTTLSVRSVKLNARAVSVLANAPSPSTLRELDLGYNGIGDEGVMALARSTRLPTLERLTLSLAQFGAIDDAREVGMTGLGVLFGSRLFSQLKRFEVDSPGKKLRGMFDAVVEAMVAAAPAGLEEFETPMPLGPSAVRALAHAPCRFRKLAIRTQALGALDGPALRELESLSVFADALAASAVEAFADAASLSQLRALRIGGLRDDAALRALATATFRPTLEVLAAPAIQPDGDGLAVLLEAGWPALRELRIPHARLDGRSRTAFDEAVLPKLTFLDVGRGTLKSDGVMALMKSPVMKRLETLYVDHNRANYFARLIAPRLRTLRIAQPRDSYVPTEPNRVAADAVAELFAGAELPALRTLSLRQWGFGDGGAATLAGSAQLPRLTCIDLSGNALTDAGAEYLAAATGLPALADLDLDHNLITAAGRKALRKARDGALPALRRVSFEGNAALRRSAQRNADLSAVMARMQARS